MLLALAILVQGIAPRMSAQDQGGTVTIGHPYVPPASPPLDFFANERSLGSANYLAFPNGNVFGYYVYLPQNNLSIRSFKDCFIYHFDMGYEYVCDAMDARNGIYLYDFASKTFFYTSPTFSFPYLYDFSLNAVLYYYPDPNNPGRYNTDGVRYFYNFSTGQIITK